MAELIKLVGFLLCLCCAIIVGLYYYGREIKKMPSADAEQYVKDTLAKWLQQNNSPPEPVFTDVLLKKSFNILQHNFNVVSDTVNYFLICDDGFTKLYFDIVTTFDESLFELTKIQLEKCLLNYYASLGFAPLTYVYYEEYNLNQFYFFLCYACTDDCKTKLSNYIKNRNEVARNNAIAREKPVIDETLEKELELFK